ncbi:MAG: phosphoglucosamine mutase [Methanomassiliicoccales archaeon]|nr:phosphoglucosamine mutase [Methanomassiliicoccales archaeon]
MAERLFGTNGVRGVVNKQMTPELAMDVGRAIGTFMHGPVAVGADTRTSAAMVKSATMAGLMSVGSSVLDLGTVPTPALQYFVKTGKIAGGVMITASHNPPEFNGIKAIDSDGTEMPRSKEEEIERIYFERSYLSQDWTGLGNQRSVSGAISSYQTAVLRQVDAKEISKAELTVVLDCANGAGSVCSPALLEKLGIRTVTLNSNPLGTFPGHPSEPTEDHLTDLKALVKETGANLGIAHDGDADRTIFIDDEGRFVHGDRCLAVLASAIVADNDGGTVVTPVSTSSCVEAAVKDAGGEVVYTRVGAPIVARKMLEIGAVFGGEENGGMIFPRLQYCRDGAMTAAKMAEVVAVEGALSDLLKKIPSYCLEKRKVRVPEKRKEALAKRICEAFADQRTDQTDGLKVYFDEGWSLIRPSGTEPIFRVYAEGRSEEDARRIADRCERVVKRLLEE